MSPDGLYITPLSQGYVLGATPVRGEGKRNAHYKDRVGGG